MRKAIQSVDAAPPAGTREAERSGVFARRLVTEIKSQWQRGEPADARAVLARHPELGSDKSVVLDLAYEEYCLRRQAGLSPDPDEFCQRFPDYRTSLRRLIEAHECLEAVTPAAADVPTSWPEVGDSFLGFVLRRELGRGAFAHVFLASEPELGNRSVVVKISRHGTVEAGLLGRLDNIPNVVAVHSVKTEDLSGWTAVCMPYVGSATLCDVIDCIFARPGRPRDAQVILKAVQRFSLPDEPVPQEAPHRLLRRGTYIDGVLHLAIQLADGLSRVHARGVCHGDLKPSNILLAPDGRPLLVDFNLSYDPQQSSQRLGGTLPYMAPEQLQPGAWERGPTPLDVRSDLFAFGVTLYELLTGQHPFGPIRGHASRAALRAELLERQRAGARPLRQLDPHIPRRLARVIAQCLAFAPEDRPQSFDCVGQELRKELRRPRVIGRWMVRHPGLSLAMLLGMLLLLSGSVAAAITAQRAWQDHQQRQRLVNAQNALQTGDYDAATTSLTRFLKMDRTSPQGHPNGHIHAALGYLMQLQHRPKEAIPHYLAAIEKGFGSAEVYNNLGFCYLRTAKHQNAALCFERAIALNPALQAGYYNRAYLTLMQEASHLERIPAAIRDMEKAIQLGPRTSTLYRHAASLHALAAESDPTHAAKAFGYLEQAIELGMPPKELDADAYFDNLRANAHFQELMHRQPVRPEPAVEADLHFADLSNVLFAD